MDFSTVIYMRTEYGPLLGWYYMGIYLISKTWPFIVSFIIGLCIGVNSQHKKKRDIKKDLGYHSSF